MLVSQPLAPARRLINFIKIYDLQWAFLVESAHNAPIQFSYESENEKHNRLNVSKCN